MTTPRVLQSTNCPLVADWCGYDRPVDPREDGDGWELSYDGLLFALTGPDGEVRFDAVEATYIIEALQEAVRIKREGK